MSIIIPGDPLDVPQTTLLGPGTYKVPSTGEIIPTSAGILEQDDKLVYIESNAKRYIPQSNDFVIGVITGVYGDGYKVQLSDFSFPVQLSAMAFPNASRKNRPNLKTGNLVYARVSSAIPEIDVEIECVDATTGKDGGFGLLEGGYLVDVSLAFARNLLFNLDFPLLNLIVKKCKFEIAIGVNGKIWVKTDDLKYTIAVANSIKNCQSVQSADFQNVINDCFKAVNL